METKAGIDQILSHEVSKQVEHEEHVYLLAWQHLIYHNITVCVCGYTYTCTQNGSIMVISVLN